MKRVNLILNFILLSLVLSTSLSSYAASGYWGPWKKTGVVSFIGGYVVCNWEQVYHYPNGDRFYSLVKTTKGWLTCPNP